MENQNITVQDRSEELLDGLAKVEDLRVEGYEAALERNATRDAANRREQTRLAQKYPKDHPSRQALNQRIAQAPAEAKAIRAQHTRASNSVPSAKPDEMVLRGTVVDTLGEPQEGLTISLFNVEQKWERPLGYTCTDPNGQFALTINDASKLAEHYKGKPLVLTVSNAQQVVLLQDSKGVTIAPAQTLTRLLVLKDANCPPPEVQEPTLEGPPPSEDQPQDKGYLVWGFVKNTRGVAMAGISVKAVANTPDGDCDLGKPAKTDGKGRYKIPYSAADFGADPDSRPDIVLTLDDANGTQIFQTKGNLNSPRIARIDVCVRKKWFCF